MANLGITLFPHGMEGPGELIRLAGDLEQEGVDHFFLVEGGNDSLTALAGLALTTKSATIGSAIANIYIRHPYAMALAAANIDDLSGGRFALGLGTAHQIVNVQQLGFDMDKPLARMRDYVTCVRAALDSNRAPVQITTERYQMQGSRLTWAPRRNVPIYLAALSDGMVRLAASHADGVILSLATIPQIRHIREILNDAAETASRRPNELKIIAIINTALRPDRATAREVLRPSVTSYSRLPFYQRELARNGITIAGGPASDEAVDALGIAGPESFARERIAEYREAGVDVPVLSVANTEPDIRAAYWSLAKLAG